MIGNFDFVIVRFLFVSFGYKSFFAFVLLFVYVAYAFVSGDGEDIHIYAVGTYTVP